jgi:glycosyltransferase involved in cell wall biosynthesis
MTVLRLPRPPQRRLLRRRYQPYLTHVPLSYLALRRGGYDVAHAFYPTDALAATRWRQKTGRPALLTYNGIPDRRGLCEHRYGVEIMAAAVRGSDAVVTVSRYAADACERWLGREAHVISPGVNLQVFAPAPARAKRPTIVCTAAADVPRKNVALLIDAFALVRARYTHARLVLVRPQDEGAARRAGVKSDAPGVEWIDHGQDRGVLARAYGEAWVAVLPSADEAFGLVLAEALACGTPVVGYAHAAIPEILTGPEIGQLFYRLEPRALAETILATLDLAGDPDMAERCRARAAEFSTARSADRYVALYHELLGQAPVGVSVSQRFSPLTPARQ